ncbi:MAG: DUF2919 family protein [Gammaproteobacteria bacterium]
MSKLYNFSDYDKYLSLKINFQLWLIIAYFMRPLILKASTIQMGFGAKSASVSGLKDLVYPHDFGFFLAVLATLPVFLVIFAYMKRKPDAPDYIGTLWRYSGKLLLLTAILNIVIVFVPSLVIMAYHINLLGWGQLVIAACIIVYLLMSRRVKDTFADFPVAGEDGKEVKSKA